MYLPSRELHDPRAAVTVADVQITVRRERDVGRQIEVAAAGAGAALRAEAHDLLPLGVQLVHHVTGASITQMFPCGSTRTEWAPHAVHPAGP
jgi:hypothetical protein